MTLVSAFGGGADIRHGTRKTLRARMAVPVARGLVPRDIRGNMNGYRHYFFGASALQGKAFVSAAKARDGAVLSISSGWSDKNFNTTTTVCRLFTLLSKQIIFNACNISA